MKRICKVVHSFDRGIINIRPSEIERELEVNLTCLTFPSYIVKEVS